MNLYLSVNLKYVKFILIYRILVVIFFLELFILGIEIIIVKNSLFGTSLVLILVEKVIKVNKF